MTYSVVVVIFANGFTTPIFLHFEASRVVFHHRHLHSLAPVVSFDMEILSRRFWHLLGCYIQQFLLPHPQTVFRCYSSNWWSTCSYGRWRNSCCWRLISTGICSWLIDSLLIQRKVLPWRKFSRLWPTFSFLLLFDSPREAFLAQQLLLAPLWALPIVLAVLRLRQPLLTMKLFTCFVHFVIPLAMLTLQTRLTYISLPRLLLLLICNKAWLQFLRYFLHFIKRLAIPTFCCLLWSHILTYCIPLSRYFDFFSVLLFLAAFSFIPLRLLLLSAVLVIMLALHFLLWPTCQLGFVEVKFELLTSKIYFVFVDDQFWEQQWIIMLHLGSFGWALRKRVVLIVVIATTTRHILYIYTLSFLCLSKVTIHSTYTERNICLGPFFLDLLLELLVQPHATIADQDIIYLFEVKVNMVMVMCVVSPMLFMFSLFVSTSLFCLYLIFILEIVALYLGHIIAIFICFTTIRWVVKWSILRLHLEASSTSKLIRTLLFTWKLLIWRLATVTLGDRGATAGLMMKPSAFIISEFCILSRVHDGRRVDDGGRFRYQRSVVGWQEVLIQVIVPLPMLSMWTLGCHMHLTLYLFTIVSVVFLSLIIDIAILSRIHFFSHRIIKLIRFIYL